MTKYKITILSDAGAARSNGKPAPIVASRGRIFFVYGENSFDARERFKRGGIPAYGMLPAVPKLFNDDFGIKTATAEDEKTVIEENWTKARP